MKLTKIIQMIQSDEMTNEWEIYRWIDYSKYKIFSRRRIGSVWKAEWIHEEILNFINQICINKRTLAVGE
ncbi:hypothetical protein Glove_508g28 [Diversispora epigaea]|uniref:Uncharacterized protein n=1 Tax=Diversispora epigaea TaxID=1348612 RepID=A0A397GLR9_9GLOM|nr:hypothetical protein Glove_508g28 [Diversispora epigaea]